jgi:L-asparaginase
METITLFITGGTLDKVYDETLGRLSFKKTHLTEILEQAKSNLNIELQELMLVDSLDMNALQRTEIVTQCKKTIHSKIIITHGTDTMVATATELAKENLQKTIVLTGAMIPYKVTNSDGLFNLGSALAFVQILPIGIYIAMNGHYFPWNDVQKNKSLGKFENL